jgi:HemY protein
MKVLIVSLLLLTATVAAALFILQDSGHVIIAYRDWTIESSLTLLIAGIVILFIVFYYGLRLWSGLRSLPRRVRRWRRQRRDAKVRASYLRGMTALLEGRWTTAEKYLLKEVRHSDAKALHYIAAAQSAEAQGSQARRDSYLRTAAEQDAKAEAAVGLAQAGYFLENRQADDARAILDRLHAAQPKQPAVLKRLMEVYIALQEWERLLDIIPELERRDVVHGIISEQLLCLAYRGLFAQAALQKDREGLHRLWDRVPRSVRRNEDMLFDYARALVAIDPHAGAQLESLLADAIDRHWNDALVYIYGQIPSENPGEQLAFAERWLKHHSRSAVLLLTLGRLCVRNQLWGKGRSYLEASLGIEAHAETYRELGALLEKLDNKGAALDCYRKALSLVPEKFFAPPDAQVQRPIPPLQLPMQSR